MPPKLRYEFFLPTFYNNEDVPGNLGKPIEAKKFRLVRDKVIEKFGSISKHPGTILGTWTDKNSCIRYFDNCWKFEVCVENTDDAIEFFEKLKEYLMKEFEQEDIYMVFTEVIMV